MTITNLPTVYHLPFDGHDPDLATDMLVVAMDHIGATDPDMPEVQEHAIHMMFDWLRSMGEDPMETMVDYIRPEFA